MAKNKVGNLSAGLLASKGQAKVNASLVDSGSSAREIEPGGNASKADSPLNFKVDAEFRRRFKTRAAEADLKLNELLRQALDAWEEKHFK